MGEHCRERESRLRMHLFHLFLHLQGPLVAQAQEGRSDLETASLTENNKIIMKQRIMKIVVTHLELDILECEIRWALGSITTNKASGSDGTPAELFQILKVLRSIYQQIWKIQQWPQDWKRSVFIPISKKGSVKECSNYYTTVLIPHPSKVMSFKILSARLQQNVN